MVDVVTDVVVSVLLDLVTVVDEVVRVVLVVVTVVVVSGQPRLSWEQQYSCLALDQASFHCSRKWWQLNDHCIVVGGGGGDGAGLSSEGGAGADSSLAGASPPSWSNRLTSWLFAWPSAQPMLRCRQHHSWSAPPPDQPLAQNLAPFSQLWPSSSSCRRLRRRERAAGASSESVAPPPDMIAEAARNASRATGAREPGMALFAPGDLRRPARSALAAAHLGVRARGRQALAADPAFPSSRAGHG